MFNPNARAVGMGVGNSERQALADAFASLLKFIPENAVEFDQLSIHTFYDKPTANWPLKITIEIHFGTEEA